MNDFQQCSNRLLLDLISILVNFLCELWPIIIRYDFIEARRSSDSEQCVGPIMNNPQILFSRDRISDFEQCLK